MIGKARLLEAAKGALDEVGPVLGCRTTAGGEAIKEFWLSLLSD